MDTEAPSSKYDGIGMTSGDTIVVSDNEERASRVLRQG